MVCKWCGKKSLSIYCSKKCLQEAYEHGVDVGSDVEAWKRKYAGGGITSLVICGIVVVVCLFAFCLQ